jgi:raffinose/stachyose/melibiose transport system permease protein
MLKPVLISVGVLEIMWIWNDYLLPILVLDRTKYKTIPIHIQYLQGSYGHVDLGAVMALIVISIVPIVVFYLTAQKYIIKGVVEVPSRVSLPASPIEGDFFRLPCLFCAF